jgi:4a-hydroxytetrahydrobiopterin dehydratase
MVQALSEQQIDDALGDLPGWSRQNGKLAKVFRFGSFKEALSFIVRLGMEAENMNHHPEIRNIYSRVELTLSTHEAGDKVTDRDVKLAQIIERFSWVH